MRKHLRSNVFLYLFEYNRQLDTMQQRLRSYIFLNIYWVQPSVWRDTTADAELRFLYLIEYNRHYDAMRQWLRSYVLIYIFYL